MSDWPDDNSNDSMDLGFDTATVDAPSYDLLPPGRYRVACTSAKVAPSKNNPSTVMATIEETIVDDESPHRGRKIWSRYVVAHADGKVMARGRADVTRMLAAYGVSGSSLAPVLHRECVAAVDIEAAKGEWEARNKIKRREAVAGQAPTAPKPAVAGITRDPLAKPAGNAPAFLARRKVATQGE
jgi:hypothetical protein